MCTSIFGLRQRFVCVCHSVISVKALGSVKGRSGTVGGRSPVCLFWVLPKRSTLEPDQHGKVITQRESLDTDML